MKKILMLFFILSNSVNAEIYKCTQLDGLIKYQKQTCIDNAIAKPIDIKPPSEQRMLQKQVLEREARIAHKNYCRFQKYRALGC